MMESTQSATRTPATRRISHRPALRNTVMIAGFAVVMIGTGAIASFVSDPLAALVIGPLLGGAVLWLYRLSTRAAYVATGSLWLAIGLHFGWNVTTVAVFGTVTSGSEVQGALVSATTSGPAWLSGGEFGPEASIFAIVVCSVVSAVLLRMARRRGRIVPSRIFSR